MNSTPPSRPLDSGRKDALGRTIRVADNDSASRATAPTPPGNAGDDLVAAIRHFTVANDLQHPDVAPLAEHLHQNASRNQQPVYRGLYGTNLSGIAYTSMQPGTQFGLPAGSSSADREVAESFSWDDTGDDDDWAITLELHDSVGVDISEHSQFPDQQEHLLIADQYEVESVDAHPDDPQQLHIVARRIPHHPVSSYRDTPTGAAEDWFANPANAARLVQLCSDDATQGWDARARRNGLDLTPIKAGDAEPGDIAILTDGDYAYVLCEPAGDDGEWVAASLDHTGKGGLCLPIEFNPNSNILVIR